MRRNVRTKHVQDPEACAEPEVLELEAEAAQLGDDRQIMTAFANLELAQIHDAVKSLDVAFDALRINDGGEPPAAGGPRPAPPQPAPPPAGQPSLPSRPDPALQALADLLAGATTQQGLPPYRVLPSEAERLVEEVEGMADSLRRATAPDVPAAAARLALALSDARLCGTSLYQTFAGRWRLRTCFGALRIRAGHTGCRLVWAEVRRVARALMRPLPLPEECTEHAVREEDVETLARHALAFVEAATSNGERPDDAHHFEIDFALAERLATYVDDLSMPFVASPRPTRALALFLRAFVLRVFDRRHAAIELLYEAWSELRRKQLTPSALEARIVPILAQTLFNTQQFRAGRAVAQAAYAVMCDTKEETELSRFRLERVSMDARRWIGDKGAARRHARAMKEVAERLAPDLWELRAWAAFESAVVAVLSGSARESYTNGTRCAALLVQHCDPGAPHPADPTAPSGDPLSFFRYSLALLSPGFVALEAKIGASALQRVGGERTPVVAHAFYQLAEYQLAAGDRAAAQRSLEKCVAAYTGPFEFLYPPEHPRRRRAEEALGALRAGRPPSVRYAEFLPSTGAGARAPAAAPAAAAAAVPPAVLASVKRSGVFARLFLSRRAKALQPEPEDQAGGAPADELSPLSPEVAAAFQRAETDPDAGERPATPGQDRGVGVGAGFPSSAEPPPQRPPGGVPRFPPAAPGHGPTPPSNSFYLVDPDAPGMAPHQPNPVPPPPPPLDGPPDPVAGAAFLEALDPSAGELAGGTSSADPSSAVVPPPLPPLDGPLDLAAADPGFLEAVYPLPGDFTGGTSPADLILATAVPQPVPPPLPPLYGPLDPAAAPGFLEALYPYQGDLAGGDVGSVDLNPAAANPYPYPDAGPDAAASDRLPSLAKVVPFPSGLAPGPAKPRATPKAPVQSPSVERPPALEVAFPISIRGRPAVSH
eukprot:tig00020684_g12862.t1